MLPALEYVNSCSARLMILKVNGNIFRWLNVALLLQVCHEHMFNIHFPFLFLWPHFCFIWSSFTLPLYSRFESCVDWLVYRFDASTYLTLLLLAFQSFPRRRLICKFLLHPTTKYPDQAHPCAQDGSWLRRRNKQV